MRAAAVAVVLGWCAAGAAGQQAADAPRVVTSAVLVRTSPDGGNVAVRASEQTALPLGSQLFVFDQAAPVARASVVLRQTTLAAGPVDWCGESALAPGMAVAVLPPASVEECRAALPDTVSPGAAVEDVSTSGSTAWLQFSGTDDGWQSGDTLLATRQGWPIARLRIDQCFGGRALAQITPLVGNTRLRAGDSAAAWPTPSQARAGRLSSYVMRVERRGEDTDIWIPIAGPAYGDIGEQWEILRGGQYVCLATSRGVNDRFVICTASAALCKTSIRVGDAAAPRRRDDLARGECTMRVFRVEGDYCLLNAGERDGIAMDQPLFIMRDNTATINLRVTMLNEEHCGARVVARVATGDAPRAWDVVSTRSTAIRKGGGRVIRILAADAGPATASMPAADRKPRGIIAIQAERTAGANWHVGDAIAVRDSRGVWGAVIIRTGAVDAWLVPLSPRLESTIDIGDAVEWIVRG